MNEPLLLIYLAVNDHDRERVFVQIVGVKLHSDGLIFGDVDNGSRSRTFDRLDFVAFDFRVLERKRVAGAECFFSASHIDFIAVDVVASIVIAGYVRRLVLDLVLFTLIAAAEQIHTAAHESGDQSERHD